jgi:hypothetical protein
MRQPADVLAAQSWMRHAEPFPHVVARSAFVDEFYNELDAAFGEVLAHGFGGRPDQLDRRIPGYDAYGLTLPAEQPEPFGLFVSRAWHDLLAGVLGVTGTGYVTCGLHHHAVGSASGQVHNDLNPSWFAVYDSPSGIRVTRHDLVGLTSGEVRRPGIETVEMVRAGVMLLYLHNPPWRPGDGGGTGLYAAVTDEVERPYAMVPPLNNSILAFECTPYSYHSFIHNAHSPRNCLILWLHEEPATVASRWGLEAIVPWAAERGVSDSDGT